ncbi:LmeA family phospholipid-binding protein [bacterium]|nr:LmeA family phospholipid-binding protein [bacterium]
MGCIKRLANCSLALVLLIAVAGVAAYYYLLPRLDGLLEDAVRREFMLPPSSTVGITRGTLLDTCEGEVDKFYVKSAEARISGLNVEDVEFHATGIKFDLPQTLVSGQAELTSVDYGELSFKVSEKALKERWGEELQKKGLQDVEVTLADDLVTITGNINLLVTAVRVGAAGRLEVDGSDRIRFIATDLELGGATIGIEELKAVFSTLTPVLDLGQFKMSVAIEDVRMHEGYIFVEAHSMSLDEKAALAAARGEQAAAEGADDSGGKHWRIPSLKELEEVFTADPEKDDESSAAADESAGDESAEAGSGEDEEGAGDGDEEPAPEEDNPDDQADSAT